MKSGLELRHELRLAKKKGTKNIQIAGDFKRQFSVDKNIIKFKKQKLRSNSTK